MKDLYCSSLRALIFSLLLSQSTFAQIYFEDTTFHSTAFKNAAGSVSSFIIQPDNKILVSGDMNFADDVYISSPVRLNADGSRDTSFYTELFSGGFAVVQRTDGRLITKSKYTSESGIFIELKLLNQHGDVDSTFLTTIRSGSIISESLAVQQNNKVVVGSLAFENGLYVGTVNRVNTDGSLDNSFNTGNLKINWVNMIFIQADEKIIVTGDFEFPGGIRNDIVRLNADGSVDEAFTPPIMSFAGINALAFQQDGKILISGQSIGFIRLNPDGTTDLSFNSSIARVMAIAVQPDGKILISNWIQDKTNFYIGYSQVLRLNADGSHDPSFVNGVGAADHSVTTLGVTATGDIIAAGNFTSYNDQPTHGMVRLRGSDGSVDATFNPKLETSGSIQQVTATEDEKIYVAGAFDIVGNHPRSGIARFNSDGSIDNTFNIGTGIDGFWDINGGSIQSMAIQSDKKILAGGSFTSFNGKPANGLLRLNANGSVDESFAFTDTNRLTVNTITIQADGKIIVTGSYYNSEDRLCKRLNADGSVDTTFTPSINGYITGILVQADGKIIVCGYFTIVNDTVAGHIVRLNSDGSIDDTFLSSGTTGTIYKIALQPDGKLLVGGSFADFNDTAISSIVRLNTDGTLDPAFNASLPDAYIQNIFFREDGKILVTGAVDFKPYLLLNSDGTQNSFFHLFKLSSGSTNHIVALMGMKMISVVESRLISFYVQIQQPIDLPVTNIEKDEQPVLLYPIPASDKLIVEMPGTVPESIFIRLFDTRGVSCDVTINKDTSGFQLETLNLPRGIYVLSIDGRNIHSTHRVVLK